MCPTNSDDEGLTSNFPPLAFQKSKSFGDVPIIPHPARDKRTVCFSNCIIREYEREVGDNPDVCGGPPLTIGWEYSTEVKVPVEKFEDMRSPMRRPKPDLMIPATERRQILKDSGASLKEIRKATEEARDIRRQRQNTKDNRKWQKHEETLECIKRRTVRVLTRRSKTKEFERLWKKAEKWQQKHGEQ
mmetsp:Transcript_9382/g.11582  ORF Transcript_9382/g.11582 Transcript_9382/m.11582 type:complete len:188 (+) Transcript_9382:124-687(+)|eukprot:CAMPEP_0172502308 /NCGR_PEP_ID=MMETSP1066-20121228/158684_1 /TAXON_ID=671091 /ORGANISM="Coscinodiscus wailesii, Strain CCMP2513" /LENGTH=187 /DNA_ID=CAMNT_0013277511 /DNA_START=118 /DNA_END=681 /DNA_ORIENTATION=+